jgi:hypothetical protein
MLDNNLLSHAKSDYGVVTAIQLMDVVAEINSSTQVEIKLVKRLIEEADDIYEFVESMSVEDEENYSVE